MSSEMLQQLYLTQSSLRENLLAEDISDFLDGDAFARLIVRRRADDAISTLPKLFGDGVPLVDDEVLVEHLEDLSALQCGVSHSEDEKLLSDLYFVTLRKTCSSTAKQPTYKC